MIKDLLKFKSGKSLDIQFPIRIKDSNGNEIYLEDSDGYWVKREFDSNGNRIYFESSNGYWVKRELDSNGNQIYFENSAGFITDDRPKEIKELSVEEIQEKLGFKIKIVEK